MKNTKFTAVILAAGQGKRMNTNTPKQYLMIKDKPILYYTLKAFEESNIDEVILAVGSGQIDYCKKHIVDEYQFHKVTRIIEGGAQRYDSVYSALSNILTTDYVLIHDGARPFISKELIRDIMQSVAEYKACIIGTPVKETIKLVNEKGHITETPNRNALWTAQTPQAFDYQSIRKAYELFYQQEDFQEQSITDDSMIYELYIKKPVKVILGDYRNIKITTREDLRLAEVFMEDLLY